MFKEHGVMLAERIQIYGLKMRPTEIHLSITSKFKESTVTLLILQLHLKVTISNIPKMLNTAVLLQMY